MFLDIETQDLIDDCTTDGGSVTMLVGTNGLLVALKWLHNDGLVLRDINENTGEVSQVYLSKANFSLLSKTIL
jgi:hypothetical protein